MDFNVILDNIIFCQKSKRKINEEETKMYLLYPFLRYLGYSVYSPKEIVFEYVCDMHENGNRRVDCAIMNDDIPIFIIEVKPFGEQLSAHWGQIKSYFISSGAKYAVLTNGQYYHIFENVQIDSDYSNCTPKYVFALDKLSSKDYEIIKLLSKINLKPAVISTNDSINKQSDYQTEEETGFYNFCSTIKRDNVVNSQVNDLYNKYVTYCKNNSLSILSKIAFSKKINKYYSTNTTSKRIGNKVHRFYV